MKTAKSLCDVQLASGYHTVGECQARVQTMAGKEEIEATKEEQ
jgi:hypothetical protein